MEKKRWEVRNSRGNRNSLFIIIIIFFFKERTARVGVRVPTIDGLTK